MNEQLNEATLRRVLEEGFSKGNYAALDGLFTPDYIKTWANRERRDLYYTQAEYCSPAESTPVSPH